MAAPSKSFTVIPDADVDPDSPVDTGLMTALRDNDIHLEEWLGFGFTAAQDHKHDGVDSALVAAQRLELLASVTAGSDLDTLTIETGLDGNADKRYLLACAVHARYAVGAQSDISIQFNANAAYQLLLCQSGVSSPGKLFTFDLDVIARRLFGAVTLERAVRTLTAGQEYPLFGASVGDISDFSIALAVWANHLVNITSIEVVKSLGGTAGGIGTGSKFNLYRFKD